MLFVVAAVGCGIAGALYLANTLFIQTGSVFGVQWTAYMLFMVLVGGLGTFEGPILGAVIFYLIQAHSATAAPGTSWAWARSPSRSRSSCPTGSGVRSTAGSGCDCCRSVTHYEG